MTPRYSAGIVQGQQMRWVEDLLVCESRQLSSTEVAEHGAVDREGVFLQIVPRGGLVRAGRRRTVESEKQEHVFHLRGVSRGQHNRKQTPR
jgi:hypothetical protein